MVAPVYARIGRHNVSLDRHLQAFGGASKVLQVGALVAAARARGGWTVSRLKAALQIFANHAVVDTTSGRR